jgi:hypothetical protein
MLAGVRNVAFGSAIVMTGLLAVMLAERVSIVLFLSDWARPLVTSWGFPAHAQQQLWYQIEALASHFTASFIGVAVMIWLVGRMVRRASKSIAAHRSFL